jgi:hypothetical protein
MSFCVIVEYFRIDLELDGMVTSRGWANLPAARKRCQYIKRKLNGRPNVIVNAWRIEDGEENVVARCRS